MVELLLSGKVFNILGKTDVSTDFLADRSTLIKSGGGGVDSVCIVFIAVRSPIIASVSSIDGITLGRAALIDRQEYATSIFECVPLCFGEACVSGAGLCAVIGEQDIAAHVCESEGDHSGIGVIDEVVPFSAGEGAPAAGGIADAVVAPFVSASECGSIAVFVLPDEIGVATVLVLSITEISVGTPRDEVAVISIAASGLSAFEAIPLIVGKTPNRVAGEIDELEVAIGQTDILSLADGEDAGSGTHIECLELLGSNGAKVDVGVGGTDDVNTACAQVGTFGVLLAVGSVDGDVERLIGFCGNPDVGSETIGCIFAVSEHEGAGLAAMAAGAALIGKGLC